MANETPIIPNLSPPTNRNVLMTLTAPPVREVAINRRESPVARRKEAKKLCRNKTATPEKYIRK